MFSLSKCYLLRCLDSKLLLAEYLLLRTFVGLHVIHFYGCKFTCLPAHRFYDRAFTYLESWHIRNEKFKIRLKAWGKDQIKHLHLKCAR